MQKTLCFAHKTLRRRLLRRLRILKLIFVQRLTQVWMNQQVLYICFRRIKRVGLKELSSTFDPTVELRIKGTLSAILSNLKLKFQKYVCISVNENGNL